MSLAVTLEFAQTLTATQARAYAAITGARELAAWFCDECESDPREGGALVMRWRGASASREDFVARWRELRPGAFAAFRGGHSGYPGGDAGSVEFRLEPSGGGCHLWVRHTMPDTAEYEPIAERYRSAWPRALARLAQHLSTPATPKDPA